MIVSFSDLKVESCVKIELDRQRGSTQARPAGAWEGGLWSSAEEGGWPEGPGRVVCVWGSGGQMVIS